METEEARSLLLRLRDALSRNDRAQSNAIALALVAGNPPLGRQWKAISTLLQHNGEVAGARAAMDFYVAATGNDPASLYDKAALLAQTASVAQAYDLLQQLPPDAPDPHANAYSRGTMAINLGRFDEARAALRQALAVQPNSGQSRLALAMLGRVEPEDAERIRNGTARLNQQTPLEQAAWHYALGRLGEREGDIDGAASAYAAGAAIMARLRPADLKRDRDDAQQATEGWHAHVIARLASELDGAGVSRPIFVTGLPRSGTTLVEQILVSHSEVENGEELGLMRFVHQDVGDFGYPSLERYLVGGGSVAALRALYDRLLAQRFPGPGRVVDKTLNSSRSMGLIGSLFPDAPVIWVRRDPVDCAWSAYRNWFNQGLDWSWSLEAMAFHFKLEDALFFHWRQVLPSRIHVVAYEELVTEPEQVIAEMLEFCGLDFQPAVLQPELTARTVTTASVAQVREKITPASIGSAKPYHRFMAPFMQAYYS